MGSNTTIRGVVNLWHSVAEADIFTKEFRVLQIQVLHATPVSVPRLKLESLWIGSLRDATIQA